MKSVESCFCLALCFPFLTHIQLAFFLNGQNSVIISQAQIRTRDNPNAINCSTYDGISFSDRQRLLNAELGIVVAGKIYPNVTQCSSTTVKLLLSGHP